jgi:acyl dehydratase
MNVLSYLKEKSRNLPAFSDLEFDNLIAKLTSNHVIRRDRLAYTDDGLVGTRVVRAAQLSADMQSRLGQTLMEGDWLTLTQQHIDDFARLTGDEQWIHTDPERCRTESPYRTTVAHGFLLLAMLPELAGVRAIGDKYYPDAKFVVNCGLDNVNFLNPAKSGTRVRAKTTLLACERQGRRVDLRFEIVARSDAVKRSVLCESEVMIRVYF